MSEDNKEADQYVILSRKPEDSEKIASGKPVVVSGLALIAFTIIYILFIITLPLGIFLEVVSNYVLEHQGITIGFSDRPFGLREVTAIYSAGLFFFLLDVFQAVSNTLSQYVSERRMKYIMKTYPRIWGNLLIFVFIVPLVVVGITTLAASEFSNPEDLWEIVMAGYAGAIIGIYRQVVSSIFPRY